MIGAGIIGLGVGEKHIDGYRSHPDATVVALCDSDPAVRSRLRSTYPELEVLSDADRLIDDDRIGIVSVASYDDVHFEQVMRALRRGKHVFVEKPLCLRADHFRAIRDELRAKPHLRLSSNVILRRSPRFIQLKQLVDGGELGRLYHVEGDYLYGRLEKLTQGWRGTIPEYSVTLGGTIHLIDLLLWLTSETVVEVTAMGNGISSQGSPYGGDDQVSALLRFASGMTGKVSGNFACVYPHFHRLCLYGTKATFENGRGPGLLWQTRDPSAAPKTLDTAYPGVAKGDLIPSFVDAVVGKGRALVTEDDVLAAMAVGLAIDYSLAERRPVRVEEIFGAGEA